MILVLLLLGAVLLLPLAGEAVTVQCSHDCWASAPTEREALRLCAPPTTALPRQRDDGELQYDINGSLKIDKASFEAMLKDYPEAKLRVILVPDPCLATMEAAMRELEPYLPLEVSIEVQQWVMRVLRQKTTEQNAALSREGEARAKQYAAVGETFYKAKRCWRTQP